MTLTPRSEFAPLLEVGEVTFAYAGGVRRRMFRPMFTAAVQSEAEKLCSATWTTGCLNRTFGSREGTFGFGL